MTMLLANSRLQLSRRIAVAISIGAFATLMALRIETGSIVARKSWLRLRLAYSAWASELQLRQARKLRYHRKGRLYSIA